MNEVVWSDPRLRSVLGVRNPGFTAFEVTWSNARFYDFQEAGDPTVELWNFQEAGDPTVELSGSRGSDRGTFRKPGIRLWNLEEARDPT